MPDEDGDDAAFQIAHQLAFEERFSPEAFAVVAEALGLPTEAEILAGVRRLLLDKFYFFFMSIEGMGFSRDQRVKRLEDLRDAAASLLRSVRQHGGFWEPRLVLDKAVWDEKVGTTVRRLVEGADVQILKLLSSRGRGGRPPKDQFRQLAADLVRVYERITNSEAKRPDWIGGSKYGGNFYKFAVAAERCLRANISEPEVLKVLPVSAAAIGDGLRSHWTSIRELSGEKPSLYKT